MAGRFLSMKLKRKDLDDVNDDFSDFSLSSPARKIRRLNVQLPTIMEEEDVDIDPPPSDDEPIDIEEKRDALVLENPEKAIVLFNRDNNATFLQFPSTFTLSVDPDVISGFKSLVKSAERETKLKQDEEDDCLAVVPWVPSQFHSAFDDSPPVELPATVDEESMEIEDDHYPAIQQEHARQGFDGFPQRLQQHCMTQHLPSSSPPPVPWLG